MGADCLQGKSFHCLSQVYVHTGRMWTWTGPPPPDPPPSEIHLLDMTNKATKSRGGLIEVCRFLLGPGKVPKLRSQRGGTWSKVQAHSAAFPMEPMGVVKAVDDYVCVLKLLK